MKKYLKENYTPEQEEHIKEVMKRLDITPDEFQILPDGSVDVHANVYVFPQHLSDSLIGVQFNEVTGSFDCSNSHIGSLKGAPRKVSKKFRCHNAPQLHSIEGLPAEVGNDLVLHTTGITSLVGIADNVKRIKGNFICDLDKITEGGIGLIQIEGLKAIVNGSNSAPLPKPFQIISKYLGRPDELFDCQSELIDADLEAFSEL